MKTTILEISETGILAALEEMSQSVPAAQYWQITLTATKKSLAGLCVYETDGVPEEAIAKLLAPKFHIACHVLPKDQPKFTEYISGYDHCGMNFESAFNDVLKALPSPAQLLEKKRAELAVLEKQYADLESAVRG